MGEDDVKQMSTQYALSMDMNEPSESTQVTQQRQKRSRDARKGKRVSSLEDEPERDDIFGQEKEEEKDKADDTFHFDPNFQPFATTTLFMMLTRSSFLLVTFVLFLVWHFGCLVMLLLDNYY